MTEDSIHCTHGNGSQHARRLPEHPENGGGTHLDEWGGSVTRSRGGDSIGNYRPWEGVFGVGRMNI